ncbi:hypothetical protein GGS24DRAFT_487299 [Hypoxylon argillaceum]|nr:hypothetical protein GGS24DRAFT_487299 [Hypoxylon argillaceum]
MPLSPSSTNSLSPISPKQETDSLPTAFPLTAYPLKPCKRKSEEYGGVYNVSLPSLQNLSASIGSYTHPHAPSPPRTPSLTPEPSESNKSSRRFSQDPIMAELNSFRVGTNRRPLPMVEGLSFRVEANSTPPTVQSFYGVSYPPPPPPPPRREVKRRRAQAPEATHCNVKYLIEELDFIRYHRVDLAQGWSIVEANFQKKFPMTVFPKPRESQGLQGVTYRQNRKLPKIKNGVLQFQSNGHVALVDVPTRTQNNEKHLYTFIYLFPERALQYDWISPADMVRALSLYKDRQKQIAVARELAGKNKTYVAILPTGTLCGCCPVADRVRDKKKLAEQKETAKQAGQAGQAGQAELVQQVQRAKHRGNNLKLKL